MGTLWSQERPPEEGLPTERSPLWTMARRVLVAVLLLGLLLGSSVLLVYVFGSCGPGPCEMPVCWNLLARYMASGNTSVAPCTDFFSFACGKAKGINNSFQALAEENKSRLRRILEAPSSWHLGSGEEKAFQFYSFCMDTDAIEAAGAGPLRQVIEELGGWRISGNWTSLDFNRTLRLLMKPICNLIPLLHTCQSSRLFPHVPYPHPSLSFHPHSFSDSSLFLLLRPSSTVHSPSPHTCCLLPPHSPLLSSLSCVQIDQPEFDLPVEQEQEQNYAQIVREYLTYLSQLGTLLGGDPSKVQEHASMSISITSRLLQFLRPLEQRQAQGKLFQMVTIDQLQEMAPAIDWLSCLQAIFTPMSLSPSQPLVVHDLEYLQNMSRLVEEQLSKHRDFLQSHMILGLVGSLSPALDSKFQEARRLLNQKLRELTERPPMPTHPRWMKCVKETGDYFQPTLAALFVREAFSPSTQSAAMELFTAIKDELINRLRRLPWMDEKTQKEAQDKVIQLQVKMGAPEQALEPALAGQEYNDIQIGPSYLQSTLSCVRSLRARVIQSFLQPSPHHRWQVLPWEINAYYSISDHVVVFPAGLLQPPFFHPAYPRAVNFGAAGSIMAHELLHIFYQLSSSVCGTPMSSPLHHTSPSHSLVPFSTVQPGGCPACDTRALRGALLCLEHLYAAFPLPRGISFNASYTLLENAMDIGGLAIALQAYSERLLWHRGETVLPNLNLSPQQLFFRSYAQVMCRDPSTQDSQDTHSPPTLRVNGPLSNTPSFARYFRCPLGALMNPSSRCQL
ncbi:hypothetical protein HPG69_016408, partial [Diceros bicornis minor]